MIIKTGEKVIVDYNDTDYNTHKRRARRTEGTFIKDYGNYIQVLDKLNLRRSIMKQDIVKIAKEDTYEQR